MCMAVIDASPVAAANSVAAVTVSAAACGAGCMSHAMVNARCRCRPKAKVAAAASIRVHASSVSGTDPLTKPARKFSTAFSSKPAAVRVQEREVRSGCRPGSRG